ncbi:hypothetical protein A0H81_00650 [Grifola frondosa]|uniref:LIM zinc-binding domain-containing protein n=1 Tax=Grifola frondosa TaxID=5627 RepID=A0A1C7MRB0_GRIFR|nr:hypothetical protein A0H81_00650 [Grifola frondosa]
MGFCRRCGDIVIGPRCKCGGTAVAAVVKWGQSSGQSNRDSWSRTYVAREKSPTQPEASTHSGSSTVTSVSGQPTSTTPAVKRFPRPQSASSMTTPRPPSPLKHSTGIHTGDSLNTSANVAAGILPNLNNGSELAKVYGSILQPKETLSTFKCALCSTPFPPDATIYPDPSSMTSSGVDINATPGSRFLCRFCFTVNGGSKGECPSCNKPVLILKSEGAFIENGGRFWHKRCFCCTGCFKNIGHNPMVDLLGRPSCADCFESCLKRPSQDGSTRRRSLDVFDDQKSNLGGIKRSSRSREGSPALEELEQRLGIKSKDSTPNAEGRLGRSSLPGSSNETTMSSSVYSPLAKRYTTSFGDGETSPVVERLAARARANSSTTAGSSSVPAPVGDGSPHSNVHRFKNPPLRSPAPDDDSSISVRRTYNSPGLEPPDGSPIPRRSFNRFKTPEPDRAELGSGSKSSPSFGSPRSSKQPTGEAIEEMKKRFLRQASPALTSAPSDAELPSTITPTHYSASRPRRSNTSFASQQGSPALPNREEVPDIGAAAPARPSDKPDYTLRRDRTGDAEVESLLGTKPAAPIGDLIDLGPDMSNMCRMELKGSVSKIPQPIRTSISPGSGRIGLGFRLRTLSSPHYEQSVPPTPDLAGDLSDAASTTHSSGPSTPPSVSPPSRRVKEDGKRAIIRHDTETNEKRRQSLTPSDSTPTPKSKTLSNGITIPAQLPPDARCAKCNLPLFSTKHGGKFVTVPEQPSSTGVPPKTYHTSCFRCTVCNGPFEEHDGGRAVFVRSEEGACHVECAPTEKINVSQVHSVVSKAPTSSPVLLPASRASASYYTSASSRYEHQPTTAPAATNASFTFPAPRFGSSSSCPGCQKAVSPMERGVVPGPQGTRWHTTCLVCGGKDVKARRQENGKPGCGKKLDSAAKSDREGGVWCRECLILLPMTMRQSPSPVRSSPISAPTRGTFGAVPQQFTGTTTLARQFTGLGGGTDAALMRQLTGGGLSPTRQLSSSPTKMYDGPRPGARNYPRPKSAIGMRSTKSEGGEGRGMFLVRQLTGGREGSGGSNHGM